MKKKLIIVGGGITGCISALYAKLKDFDVEIYEKFNYLGGILKDDCQDDFFISGCQYLNTKATWFNLIKDLKEDFVTFKAKYASYTKLDNQNEIFAYYFQGPVFSSKRIPLKTISKKKVYGSLLSRISCYGTVVEEKITNWLKKNIIDFENLSYLSLIPLGLKKISIKGNSDFLLELKNKNKNIDEIYGLSRKKLGLEDLHQAIPEKGYTSFF